MVLFQKACSNLIHKRWRTFFGLHYHSNSRKHWSNTHHIISWLNTVAPLSVCEAEANFLIDLYIPQCKTINVLILTEIHYLHDHFHDCIDWILVDTQLAWRLTSGCEVLVQILVFNTELLGCWTYLTWLDTMDLLRVRVPFHPPCTDDVLKNEYRRTKVEQHSYTKWITTFFAMERVHSLTKEILLKWAWGS